MRKFLKWGGIVFAAVALLAIGAAIGGGGDDDPSTSNAARSGDERGERAAGNAAKDDDGDGVLNPYDPEPDNPDVSSYAEVEEAEEPEPAATPDPTDCDSLGINSSELNEGACEEAGQSLKVVNRDTKLVLPELAVRYRGYTTAQTIGSDIGSESASGTFVVVRLEVTNRTDAPVTVEPDGIELTLTRQGRTRTYSHDFDAENLPGESLVWNGDELQPGNSVSGTVVYDVPKKFASELERSGNLVVLQFSDADGFSEPRRRIGVIRTYN